MNNEEQINRGATDRLRLQILDDLFSRIIELDAKRRQVKANDWRLAREFSGFDPLTDNDDDAYR
jgi:hypothetical protein